MSIAPLRNRRLLLVEDEGLIALELETLLNDAGAEVVGPISTLTAAMRAAETAEVDAALLDVSLHRDQIWPAAEILARRNVPLLFLTGYASLEFPKPFEAALKLEKPVTSEQLLRQLTMVLAPA